MGTKILVADCNSSSNAVVYDIAARAFSAPLQFPGFIYNIAASPDGSKFLISDDTYGIGLYDAHSSQSACSPHPTPFGGFIFKSR